MIQLPRDMNEIRVLLEQLRERGEEPDETTVIKTAVEDNAQALLDEVMEGHYFTSKLSDDGTIITVYDVLSKPVGTIKALSDNYVSDFKAGADGLWVYLDTELNRIAGGR